MCCSVSRGVPVRFSDTVLYAAEAAPFGDKVVHVLGYQNRVQNRAGELSLAALWPFGGVGNAMILPFPAVPRTMTAANVLDTKPCRDVLQDVANAVRIAAPAPAAMRSLSVGGAAPRVQVFRAAGIYTVVLAADPRDIPAALEQVPRRKRPTLNADLFAAYADWYPGWTVALCCFNNRRAKLAHPMLWWYEPMHPDRLFLPAVDCHTGDVPDLAARVDVDHVLAVASHRRANPPRPTTAAEMFPPAVPPFLWPRGDADPWRRVRYRDDLPAAVAPYLAHQVLGRPVREAMPNGDFVCDLADVRNGVFAPRRTLPVAA